MKELMVHVERAVRPVRADAARKLKMRRELLAHLTTVFEEERDRLGDDRAALDEARRRFGDPAELTRDLQASVPAHERWGNGPIPGMGRLEGGLRMRAGESALGHALRLATAMAAFMFCGLFILPVFWVVGGMDWSVARVGLACVGVLTAFAFLSVLLIYGFCREFIDGFRAASFLRATAYGVADVALGAALIVALDIVQPENPLWRWLLLSPGSVSRVVLSWFVVLPLAALTFRLMVVRQRRYDEWKSLEIGE